VDTETIIRQVGIDLEAAEAQLGAAQDRVQELRTIREGLRLAAQRYGQVQTPVQPVDSGAPDADDALTSISQTDLCYDVLVVKIGRRAATQEIREKANETPGRDLSHEQVRNALGYLLRKKRIKRIAPGLWEPLPRIVSVTDSGPADRTAGPNQAGENGTSNQGGVLTGAGLNSHPARQASF
jgi:hypothetical protein